MRPLRALERQGVSLSIMPCSTQGVLNPDDVKAAIQPNTTMIVLNHASNVIGTLLPIAEVRWGL
jgi:cysteine sulfinate desulfinase/cysteine desulfurase-like protein